MRQISYMYEKSIEQTEKALRKKGVVAIMLKAHANSPEDIVTTVTTIHQMGYFPEITYRIDEGMVAEAMSEISKVRDDFGDDPLRVGIGSITEPRELEKSIELGFDMVVSPDNAFEGAMDVRTDEEKR